MTLSDNEIEQPFQDAGFEVFGRFPASEPSATKAFNRVMNVAAKPIDKIPCDELDAVDKVNKAWVTRARNSGVLTGDGSFLAIGSLDYGWLRLRLTSAANIFALEQPDGDLLFIARSFSGHRVCAVSREGSEYWILEEEFLPGGS
ncbi:MULTISPECIES: hypothetical protein [Streptomyces]|uniref:Uncharacterized protein n=1 Tax=Streptomyces eurythermus TaxID=42237 RepID=A0ABW6Z3X2_9ACTN|nr:MULTISPECIES: hypothetical protein [Streptomyces]QIS72893.1 hypothetical protein HB370_25365 [Streptomyces sp. DSM 40868]